MSIESVITLKQQDKLVSASCHNADELKTAEKLGLDFVVLSPVKQTSSHPEAQALGWNQFEQLSDLVSLPVYALGGLKTADVEEAWSRGAQGVASISGFWQ
jgi:8-oxo-dGTP diphosphatase